MATLLTSGSVSVGAKQCTFIGDKLTTNCIRMVISYQILLFGEINHMSSGLQMRGDIEDNLELIFLISQSKYSLQPFIRTFLPCYPILSGTLVVISSI